MDIIFWRTDKLFTIVMAAPFYILISYVWELHFPHILKNTLIILLITVILLGVKWYWFGFPVPNNGELFYRLIDYLYIFTGDVEFQILCLFFNWTIGIFIIDLEKFFIYCKFKFLIRCKISKYFLPFCGLFFPFCGTSLLMPQRF